MLIMKKGYHSFAVNQSLKGGAIYFIRTIGWNGLLCRVGVIIMSATIKDVALKAGVSKSTVSNVLNQHPGKATPATVQRVFKAIEELGYRPNAIARSLVRQRTDVVGVIVANINQAPYPAAVRGISDRLGENGYSILLSSNDNNPKKEQTLLRVLHERQVDGIIVVSQSGQGDNQHLIELADKGVPIVVVNRFNSSFENMSVINIDNTSGARLATERLISLGHRRIAFISAYTTGPYANKAAIQRSSGFYDAMHHAGLVPDPNLVREADYRRDGGRGAGYQLMLAMLQTVNRPTAVFCANDFMAFGVMEAARELGLRTPDDLAVIGHDNSMIAEFCTPSLTSVEQPMYEAGVAAADMLVAAFSGDIEAKNLTLACRLVIRRSCGGEPKNNIVQQ